MKTKLILILLCLNISVYAQFSTLGTSFNFAFLQNRVDSNGAETNMYLNYLNNYIHISNTTSTIANIDIDFNGSAVYYKIDSVTCTPNTGNLYSFNISPESSVTIQIMPYDSITYTNSNDGTVHIYDARVFQAMNNFQIQHKMISVNSTNSVPLTVFAENTQANSRDVSMILPDNALGAKYYAFSTSPYPLEHPTQWTSNNLGGPSEVVVLSVYDSTVINFILPNTVTSSESVWSNVDATDNDTVHGATYYTVTLNKGELFQMQSDNFQLTGTLFSGNHPFAVFSGNMANKYNCSGTCGFDHVYEQMLPMKNWGKKYVVSYLYDNKPEFVKIIPMYNNTNVNINGTLYLMNAGDVQTFQLNEGQTMYIDANSPICVTQITSSSVYNGTYHTANDPSMVMISPLTQPIENIIIAIPISLPSSNPSVCYNVSKNDYINIVAETNNIDSIMIDDFSNPVSNIENYPGLVVNWTTVASNPIYSYAIVDVTNFSTVSASSIKLYDISVNKKGFNAIVSGFNCAESYCYNAGINVTEVTSNNILKQTGLKIYPNPAKTRLNISLLNNNVAKRISILNLNGQQIYSTSEKKSNYTMDVSKFNSGIYIVKIITSQQVYIKKLEIIH